MRDLLFCRLQLAKQFFAKLLELVAVLVGASVCFYNALLKVACKFVLGCNNNCKCHDNNWQHDKANTDGKLCAIWLGNGQKLYRAIAKCRLEVFHKNTFPLVDFYKNKGLLITLPPELSEAGALEDMRKVSKDLGLL